MVKKKGGLALKTKLKQNKTKQNKTKQQQQQQQKPINESVSYRGSVIYMLHYH